MNSPISDIAFTASVKEVQKQMGLRKQYEREPGRKQSRFLFLFLMDYAGQTRVKIWGTAEVVGSDPRLVKHLTGAGYKGKPERTIRFHVEASDINYRQHIQPKFTKKRSPCTCAAAT